MWIVVLRPLVVLLGLLLTGSALLVTADLPPRNTASDALMYWVFAVMLFQGVVGVGCMVGGVWGPVQRWLEDHRR